MRSSIPLLLIVGLALGGDATAQPGPVDPCNFRSRADAGITGSPGRIDTHHFGQVTNFDCGPNSWRFYLQAEVQRNNGVYWARELLAPRRVRAGQFLLVDRSFYSCSGAWVAVSHTGYYQYGVRIWDDTSVTGPFFAYCPPPPPPICQKPYQDTTTWILPASGPAVQAVEQLGVALTRWQERSGETFFAEEWALVAGTARLTGTPMVSTRAFRDRVLESSLPSEYAHENGGRWLVVQAPRHAMNARHIPLPDLVPLAAEVSAPHGAEFWFRAEIGADRAVDRVMILDASDRSATSAVRAALRDGLTLDYADDRRHPAVVFGVARVDGEGLLVVEEGKVILPQCCCGEVFCQ